MKENKRTMPLVLCLCLEAFVFFGCVQGAANDSSQASGSSEASSSSSAGAPPPTAPGTIATPEGLKSSSSVDDFWKRDTMTGDWDGFRDVMENAGVTFSPTYTGEVFGNPSGGAKQGLITDGMFNLVLDIDLDKITNGALANTTIHANAFYIYGSSLSASDVGDFSNISNIAAYNTIRLQELWIEKLFWDKRLSLKIGNMAVDNEFFQSSSAALFINGTFGAFDLIANNVPNAPVYPLASPGVRLMLQPTSAFYVMAGVYGMDNHSVPNVNNQNGTRFALDGSSGMLVMSEAGYLLNQSPNDQGLQGTYRIGSFVHTSNYTTWTSQANAANGTGSLQSAGTNYGIYGVMDQQLYTQGDQAISFFVRSGGAPSNVNFVDYYVDSGFNFTGFLPGRGSDVAGLAVARAHVSDDFSNARVAQGDLPLTAETVIEATYKVQLTSWWSVQPDLQYIITPSGVQGSQNALVLGVRTDIAF